MTPKIKTQKLHPLLEEFDNRHSRCIATDGEYTDKEMVNMLSERMKKNYEEDREMIRKFLEELKK